MSVKLSRITVEYTQEADGNDTEGYGTQSLEITAEPALLHLYENGTIEHFFTIKTKRFAFDNEKELIAILKDFKKRIKDI